jgi:hypothetical protein
MPSRTYTKRALVSVAAVFGLSCLVLTKGTWEDALHAPWMLPAFIFENSNVMAAIMGTPIAAGACTLTLLLLAARHNLSAILAAVFFSLNIFATIDFLDRYDGHS